MATPPDFTAGSVLTAAQMNAVGLWLLETKTLTASAGPIQFDNKFTTDYDSYLLVGSFLQNTSTGLHSIQLQDVSNNAVTGANYNTFIGGSYLFNGAVNYSGFFREPTGTNIALGGSIATKYLGFEVTFMRPRAAVETTGFVRVEATDYDASYTNLHLSGGYTHEVATAYYGCRINISAGTVTGKVSLYGYNA